MLEPGPKQALALARETLARPMSFDAFLDHLAPKDKVNAEKRLGVLEAGPDPARVRVWRRLACALMTLAPGPAKFVGRQTVQFYIPDGKYRMQVFAMEDLQDGALTIYCPDALAEAVDAGLLRPAAPPMYLLGTSGGEPLHVESLDGKSLNPAAHYKDLMGWNRKALRIVLPPSASPPQVEAAELLCALAARHFVRPPA